MEIKVEVLKPGNKAEYQINCPDCNHSTSISLESGKNHGLEDCWYCNALLKWEVIKDG